MKKILFIFLLLHSFNCLSKEITLVCDATMQYIKNADKVNSELEVGKPTQLHFEIDFDEEKKTLSLRGLAWYCSKWGRKIINETLEINKKTISFGCKSENTERRSIRESQYFEGDYSISRSTGKLSAWYKSYIEDSDTLGFFNIEGTCNLPKNKF